MWIYVIFHNRQDICLYITIIVTVNLCDQQGATLSYRSPLEYKEHQTKKEWSVLLYYNTSLLNFFASVGCSSVLHSAPESFSLLFSQLIALLHCLAHSNQYPFSTEAVVRCRSVVDRSWIAKIPALKSRTSVLQSSNRKRGPRIACDSTANHPLFS